MILSTWIRNIDDIKTAQEVFAGEDFGGTPDFTQEMADTALETGKIKNIQFVPNKGWRFCNTLEAGSTELCREWQGLCK